MPEGDFCLKDAGVCPAQMLSAAAERFAQADVLADNGLPGRLQLWSRTHGGAALPEWLASGRTIVLRPGEPIASLAKRAGCTADELRRINRYFGRAMPGTQWWVPVQNDGAGV